MNITAKVGKIEYTNRLPVNVMALIEKDYLNHSLKSTNGIVTCQSKTCDRLTQLERSDNALKNAWESSPFSFLYKNLAYQLYKLDTNAWYVKTVDQQDI